MNKVSQAINNVIEALQQEKLEYVALAVFKSNNQKPSDNWSFFNRFLMFLNGTNDARGFRQWQKVGRCVKKGAKAFYILVPVFKKVPVKDKQITEQIEKLREEHCQKCYDEETVHCGVCWVSDTILELKEKETIYVDKLVGFKPAPVFKYEDTFGEPLEEEKFDVEIPCEFEPLIRELGLKFRTTAFSRYYGAYSPHRKEIILASPELIVFLHELAHAVDDKLNNLNGSKEELEVVAELSAAVVAYLLGYKIDLKQVKHYLHQFKHTTVFRVINRVEKVVSYIIGKTTGTNYGIVQRVVISQKS